MFQVDSSELYDFAVFFFLCSVSLAFSYGVLTFHCLWMRSKNRISSHSRYDHVWAVKHLLAMVMLFQSATRKRQNSKSINSHLSNFDEIRVLSKLNKYWAIKVNSRFGFMKWKKTLRLFHFSKQWWLVQ